MEGPGGLVSYDTGIVTILQCEKIQYFTDTGKTERKTPIDDDI